ncbi:unnamed protein product [Umbelopsis vinacea]
MSNAPEYQRIANEQFAASPLSTLVDLANASAGGEIVAVTDEFFAECKNMIKPEPALFCPGRFTDQGAWMDGWESKRHNPTYDWAIVKLGFAGNILGFDIDTSHFTGNQAPAASVEATFCPEGDVQAKDVEWTQVLPKVDLPPTCHNYFLLNNPDGKVYTHVRLNNIPDGGIARFRVYGTVKPIWPKNASEIVDLAYLGNGGHAVVVSDQHYGSGGNLLLPGRGNNMGDGWETKRSRTPNHTDFVVVRLGDKGRLLKTEIDTSHFKGNYPASILLEATNSDQEIPVGNEWVTIMSQRKVGPHEQFYFDLEHTDKVFTHVKVTIFPDGGFKRLRVFGVRDIEGAELPKGKVEIQNGKAVVI